MPSRWHALTTLALLGSGALCFGLCLPALAQEGGVEEVERSLIKPLAGRSLLLDGVVVDGRMVAVGERGHVMISTDQGESWRQVEVPTRSTLTGVFFSDPENGWVVGHDAVILRTADGGESWERVYWAPEEERPLLDVWFESAESGFAVGAYGYFLKTADGGETWEPFIIAGEVAPEDEDAFYYEEGGDFHLNHVSLSESGRLYIAAEAGTVYRSDDGGESWITLPSPYAGSYFGTLPLAGDAVLLFGLRGHLFRSEDAGETWTELGSGVEAMLTDGLRLEDETVVLAGLGGTLLVSRDGGRTFEPRPQADRQGLSTILPTGDGGLILVGEFGVNKISPEAYRVESERSTARGDG